MIKGGPAAPPSTTEKRGTDEAQQAETDSRKAEREKNMTTENAINFVALLKEIFNYNNDIISYEVVENKIVVMFNGLEYEFDCK